MRNEVTAGVVGSYLEAGRSIGISSSCVFVTERQVCPKVTEERVSGIRSNEQK